MPYPLLLLAGALAMSAALAVLPASAQRLAASPQHDASPLSEAGPAALATDINEEIAQVRVDLRLADGTGYTGDMVVTHFRPQGPGPFPIAVFSHGRASGKRHEPARWRALLLARYLVRRGFAVVVPTRVGYGELGQAVDPETAGTCSNANYRPALDAMSAQIAAAVRFAAARPWADGSRVVLLGVSYGGFATISASARSLPGVVGAVNFVGGLGGNPESRPGEPCQGPRITMLAAEAGARARIPMLWLYAENDRYWGPEWPRRWHEAFVKAGGRADFAAFPPLGEDGHKLLSGGFPQWRPVVDGFLVRLGFPVPAAVSAVPGTGFARLDEVDKVPHITEAARREGYARFLAADVPRAFALAPSGAWSWRLGPDAAETAVKACQERARTQCRLYAVDDRVVWKEGAGR